MSASPVERVPEKPACSTTGSDRGSLRDHDRDFDPFVQHLGLRSALLET